MARVRRDPKRRYGQIAFALITMIGLLVLVAPSASAGPPVVTNYTTSSVNNPLAITAGPDLALWFANAGANSIGRINTGGLIVTYTGTGIDGPIGITAGPDGALWFTNETNNSI